LTLVGRCFLSDDADVLLTIHISPSLPYRIRLRADSLTNRWPSPNLAPPTIRYVACTSTIPSRSYIFK
jgi:hypothetical protein